MIYCKRKGREKTYFCKVLLNVILCVLLLCGTSLADVTGEYNDVSSDADYYEAVKTLSELGIFKGDDYGNFNPDSTITRAETAAVMCRLVGVQEEIGSTTQSVFSDVPSTHWAAGYVAKASELGIINGHGDGTFGPSDPVTYEQIITMLVRAWGYAETAASNGGYPDGFLKTAQELGIIKGDIISISAACPRSAAAVFCYNLSDIIPEDFCI